jgi:hypothetical protein
MGIAGVVRHDGGNHHRNNLLFHAAKSDIVRRISFDSHVSKKALGG